MKYSPVRATQKVFHKKEYSIACGLSGIGAALFFAAAVVAGVLLAPGTATAQGVQQTKEIIFLAGPKDHGAPGRHEYERDLRVLAESLEKSENMDTITTTVIVGEAPQDLSVYEDAAAIVINSSSDRSARETHPLFPPNSETNGTGYEGETAEFLKGLDELIRQNDIGVAVFHYATWVDNETAREYYLDWLGGLWIPDDSRNPVATWDMELENKDHPIQNGVQPWRNRDEIFSRFLLPDDIQGRTPLLIAHPDENSPETRRLDEGYGPQIASWIYERPEGGRGFVFGGMDWHENMEIEAYRKFLLNGLVWIVGMEVPEEGVQSPTPDTSIE